VAGGGSCQRVKGAPFTFSSATVSQSSGLPLVEILVAYVGGPNP
jgi:hypothetical protein